jgi:nucleoside-diphosphate-sugar epimerase
MKGCDIVFHCAALTDFSRPWEDFVDIIVEGTRRVILAAIDAGISRVVHVSSEAALVKGFGFPLVNVDESANLPDPVEQTHLYYSRSKNMAERVCLEYSSACDVVIVRPRLIWGIGDSVVLPKMVEQAKSILGFPWISGAEFLTSTANISNVIHGMLLASEHGRSGEAYFITDDEDRTVKEFFTLLLESQGIDCSWFFAMPLIGARFLAWSCLFPDLSPATLALLGQEITVSCTKAKRELGFAPIVSLAEGMEEIKLPSSAGFS